MHHAVTVDWKVYIISFLGVMSSDNSMDYMAIFKIVNKMH